jgi:hypothetical protein
MTLLGPEFQSTIMVLGAHGVEGIDSSTLAIFGKNDTPHRGGRLRQLDRARRADNRGVPTGRVLPG